MGPETEPKLLSTDVAIKSDRQTPLLLCFDGIRNNPLLRIAFLLCYSYSLTVRPIALVNRFIATEDRLRAGGSDPVGRAVGTHAGDSQQLKAPQAASRGSPGTHRGRPPLASPAPNTHHDQTGPSPLAPEHTHPEDSSFPVTPWAWLQRERERELHNF